MVMILGPNGVPLETIGVDNLSPLESLAAAIAPPATPIPPEVGQFDTPALVVVVKKVQRFGRIHTAKKTKDTVTGITYDSRYKVGLALAAAEGLNPKDNKVFYQLAARYPGRFVNA